MLTIRLRRSLLLVACSIIAAVTVSSVGLAGKPGGGGGGGTTPSGRIYYHWQTKHGTGISPPYSESLGYWSMNADGSDKRLEAYDPSDAYDFHLSHIAHGGTLWYLERHPNPGGQAYESTIYVVRDDGSESVLLLDATQLPPGASLVRWGKDDSFISLNGVDPIDLEEKIWAVEIGYDGSGVPFATTTAQAVLSAGPGNSLGLHDWSPDGTEVAFARFDGSGGNSVYVTDLSVGVTLPLVTGAMDPLWSPDGGKIAFVNNTTGNSLEVINADGTGRLALGISGWFGSWSPDSQHLTYSYYFYKGAQYVNADVYRISVTGGRSVNLTNDIDGIAATYGWR